jgi:hypothetical protein
MLLAKLTQGYIQQENVERRMRATEVERMSFAWLMTNVYYNCASFIVILSNTNLWPGVRNDARNDNRQKNIALKEMFRLH